MIKLSQPPFKQGSTVVFSSCGFWITGTLSGSVIYFDRFVDDDLVPAHIVWSYEMRRDGDSYWPVPGTACWRLDGEPINLPYTPERVVHRLDWIGKRAADRRVEKGLAGVWDTTFGAGS